MIGRSAGLKDFGNPNPKTGPYNHHLTVTTSDFNLGAVVIKIFSLHSAGTCRPPDQAGRGNLRQLLWWLAKFRLCFALP